MTSMDEAHSRDTRKENRLRTARNALLELQEAGDLPPGGLLRLDDALREIQKAMDHIVARWN